MENIMPLIEVGNVHAINDMPGVAISIIIPVYNGSETIVRTLDSIFNQDIGDSVEVIVVNDCSTDNTLTVLKDYTSRFSHSLTIVDLPNNMRQGGARNIGVNISKGEYIQFLDSDDTLIGGSMQKLLRAINENRNLDILFFESAIFDKKKNIIISSNTYPNNITTTLCGEEYICNQGVPWAPWMALYNKRFLNDNNIRFAEKVRFEDADYVLKCVLLAQRVKYLPIQTVMYHQNGSSTTNIGDDKDKILERMLSAERYYDIIVQYEETYPKGVEIIRGHYLFNYRAVLMRNIWRLDYSSIIQTLKLHPYRIDECKDFFIKITMDHRHFFAMVATILGPILKLILRIRNIIK